MTSEAVAEIDLREELQKFEHSCRREDLLALRKDWEEREYAESRAWAVRVAGPHRHAIGEAAAWAVRVACADLGVEAPAVKWFRHAAPDEYLRAADRSEFVALDAGTSFSGREGRVGSCGRTSRSRPSRLEGGWSSTRTSVRAAHLPTISTFG